MIQKPPAETSGTDGKAPSVGVMTIANRAARPTLAERGTAASLKTGAVLMSANIRTNGQRNATIQTFNWSEVTEKMGGISLPVAEWRRTDCACNRVQCPASTGRQSPAWQTLPTAWE